MSEPDIKSDEEDNSLEEYVAFHSSRAAQWEVVSGIFGAVLGLVTAPAALGCWYWQIHGVAAGISYFAAGIAGLLVLVHMFLYFWRRNAWW